MIATENNCHDVFPCSAKDVWAFFRRFRRNTETGELMVD